MVQSVKVMCSWTTQLTATSCTTEMKTQTTYMMLSRCVTPLTESHFSRHVRHFSSLYSVHHAAFSVFDDTPSIQHEIQDQAEANQPVFDTSTNDSTFFFCRDIRHLARKIRMMTHRLPGLRFAVSSTRWTCLTRFEIHHRILPLVLWCAFVTDNKCVTCCLNAMVQFSHDIAAIILQTAVVCRCAVSTLIRRLHWHH